MGPGIHLDKVEARSKNHRESSNYFLQLYTNVDAEAIVDESFVYYFVVIIPIVWDQVLYNKKAKFRSPRVFRPPDELRPYFKKLKKGIRD
uniref:Uncharacterized protein n=1 Tax=Romanomermis culicivorax TaxID=13658 RepID=A0A915K502_ROMCU